MGSEYIIYADESVEKGRYFSNFYGGALVESDHFNEVRDSLDETKHRLNLTGEAKWSKISVAYEAKYLALVDDLFRLVGEDKVKLRVMFRQNFHVPKNLENNQRENGYFLLYYQFLKHAFGLMYRPRVERRMSVRFYLDRLPGTLERRAQFRGYISGLQNNPQFRKARLDLPVDQIAEVVSHAHVLLQCVDVVLGSIQFRMNRLHEIKPEGARFRGKKTRAKERVYRHILSRIRNVTHRNFNPGITTGHEGDPANRWYHPYRHWLFKPRTYGLDYSKTRKGRKEERKR